MRGLQGLERVVQEHSVAGVHGRLIDLIDCAPQLSCAVEVTAGEWLGGGGSVVEEAASFLGGRCPFLLKDISMIMGKRR